MDVGKFVQLVEFVTRNWTAFVISALVVVPITGWIVRAVTRAQMDTLIERFRLSEQQRENLQAQLAQLAQQPGAPAPPTSRRVSSQRPELDYRPENPRRLTPMDIEKLADCYELRDATRMNPHLKFEAGDLAYWAEQDLSEAEIRREFEARSIALARADASGKRIATQGDLSHAAKLIMQEIDRSAQQPTAERHGTPPFNG